MTLGRDVLSRGCSWLLLGFMACETSACDSIDLDRPWLQSERRRVLNSAREIDDSQLETGAFEVAFPLGVERTRFALVATESLKIGDDAQVVDPTRRVTRQRNGLIASMGAMNIGARADVGSLYAYGPTPLLLDSRARVDGFIKTRTSVQPEPASGVALGVWNHAYQTIEAFSWRVDLSAAGPDQTSHADDEGALDLAPGSYGKLVMQAHSRTRLHTGQYRFQSFELMDHALLEIDNTRGAVYVWVRSALELSGTVYDYFLESNILFGYAGSQPPQIQPTFRGALLAPHAEIRLDSVQSPYRGFFYGRSVTVGTGVSVEFSPFLDWIPAARAREQCAECSLGESRELGECCARFTTRDHDRRAATEACERECDASGGDLRRTCKERCAEATRRASTRLEAELSDCRHQAAFVYAGCEHKARLHTGACTKLGHGGDRPMSCR